jgi:hypothetical protein
MEIPKIFYLIIALISFSNCLAMKDSKTIPYAAEIKMMNAQILNYENNKESIIQRTMKRDGKDHEYAEAKYNEGLAELKKQRDHLHSLQDTRYKHNITARQEI